MESPGSACITEILTMKKQKNVSSLAGDNMKLKIFHMKASKALGKKKWSTVVLIISSLSVESVHTLHLVLAHTTYLGVSFLPRNVPKIFWDSGQKSYLNCHHHAFITLKQVAILKGWSWCQKNSQIQVAGKTDQHTWPGCVLCQPCTMLDSRHTARITQIRRSEDSFQT